MAEMYRLEHHSNRERPYIRTDGGAVWYFMNAGWPPASCSTQLLVGDPSHITLIRVAEAGGAGEDVADRWVTLQLRDFVDPYLAPPAGASRSPRRRRSPSTTHSTWPRRSSACGQTVLEHDGEVGERASYRVRIAIHTRQLTIQSLQTAIRSGREAIPRLRDAIRSDQNAIRIDRIAVHDGRPAIQSD
jgi:hypothetical protein